MNALNLRNFNHKRFDMLYLIIIIFFLLVRFFDEKDHFLEHDEVNTINLYTDIRSTFSKNVPNNHVLTSFFGFFINFIFGVDIKYLRLVSFLSFILIVLLLYLITQNIYAIFFLLVAYISSPILLTYSVLYRGYYLQALLFAIIFYILTSHKIEFSNKVKLIFLLSNLLLIHIISSLYLLIPIGGVLLYLLLKTSQLNLREKFNLIWFYLFIPFILMHSIIIFITTLFNNRISSPQDLIVFIRDSEQGLLSNTIYVFSQIYFNTWVVDSPLTIEFLENFGKNNITLSLIFILAFFKSVYQLYKEPRPIDWIVLLFFVTFLIINKSPFDRVFTGLVFFFLFYLLFNLKTNNSYYYINYATKTFLLIAIIFFISNINFFKNFFLYSAKELYIKENFDICSLSFEPRDEMDKQIFYYLYLRDCDKKTNVVEFYDFYTR